MVLVGKLGKAQASEYVNLKVRILDMFFSPEHLAYLTTADSSGRILVEVKKSISQTLYVGSIIGLRGAVALRYDHIMVVTIDIHKLQETEDGFQ